MLTRLGAFLGSGPAGGSSEGNPRGPEAPLATSDSASTQPVLSFDREDAHGDLFTGSTIAILGSDRAAKRFEELRGAISASGGQCVVGFPKDRQVTLAVVQRDFDNDRAIEQTARIAAEFGTPLVVPEYIFESVKAGQRLATRAFEVPTSALLSRPSLQQSNSASQIRIEPARPNMKRFHSFQITKGSEEHQHASVTQRATDPRRGSLGSSSRKRSGSPRQGNAVGVQNYYLGGTKSKTEASSSESSGDEGTEDEDMAPRSPDDSKAAPSTSSGGEREAAVPEGLTSDASAVKGEGEQNGEADGKDSTGKKAPQPRQPPPVPKSAPPDLAPLKKESTKDVGVSGKSRPLKAAMPPLNLAAQPSPVLTPGKRERLEWQAMLSSVLNGDVIRSEKQRLGSTDSTRKRGDPEERLAIWLGVKAATSGRRVDDERKFLEEFRKTEVDSILEEVVRFEVREGTGIPSAFEQVVAILDKVDLVESLYPSRRAITADKPIYASLSFQYNLDALVSWLSITRALRMQLQILKNWTGSETLSMMGGDRSFIERILKESGVKGTFERRIMSVLKGMVRRTKQAMTNNAAAFRRMRLPTHIDELRQLAQFPSNLLEEFLKLRLEYTENLIKPVGAGGMGAIAELVEDSSISLGLAARIKEETIDLDTPADGWTITNSLSTTYDSVFLASLRFYFRLLSWRLRSSAEIVFFKEVEMLETEWEFLTEQVAPWLEGGDVEIAEQFCKLEEELLRKVNAYFQAQMNVAPGSLSPQSAPADVEGPSGGLAVPPIPSINNPQVNLARWYKSRVLENVRARSRKLLRFMKSLISEFELASEYLLVDLDEVIRKLQATDHILVDVTGTGKGVTPQGYLVFASPSLQDRHTAVRKLLRACLTRYENFREDVGEGYVLVVSPGQNKHITWRGGKVMKLNDPGSAKGYRLKSERIRLIADTGELLAACRRAFEHAVGVVAVRLKKESRAHLHSVHMALKGVKRTLYNLTEVVISSVRGVRDLIRKMNHGRSTDMGVVHDLIQEWFTFASDFGSKALRNVGGTTKRKIIQRSFVRLGIDWLDFVVVDCVNTDKRTYRWSLVALEFALKITAGNGILDLTDEEFGMFKFQVARCMSLLISHVDIQGTRQFALSASVKLESERATSEAMSDLIRGEIARLLQGGGVPSIAEHPSAAFLELEEERQKRQRGMRVIGKVLDDRNIEERNIGLLASSSSSISLRWQQGKFLGGGSYGSVYMAINLDSGDVMAVKEIKFQDVSSLEALKRSIKEEMTVMQMLHHPHIVNYYGVEVHRDKLYIFMEYCPNSLAGLLEHGRIEDENVIRIYAKQMLLGLQYLHSKNIVHRDVKPANTLIDVHGAIKFVDFGASKVYKNQKTLVVNGEHNSLIGTPHYMSPEVITGEQFSDMKKGAQDIWSLGCCVLEMVTGRKPWVNLDNEWAIMYHIGISGRHPPLPDPSQLSEAGIDFLSLCFARPAKERPTASELLEHEWMREVDENALFSLYPSSSPSAPLESAGLLTSSTSSTASPFFVRTQSDNSLQLRINE